MTPSLQTSGSKTERSNFCCLIIRQIFGSQSSLRTLIWDPVKSTHCRWLFSLLSLFHSVVIPFFVLLVIRETECFYGKFHFQIWLLAPWWCLTVSSVSCISYKLIGLIQRLDQLQVEFIRQGSFIICLTVLPHMHHCIVSHASTYWCSNSGYKSSYSSFSSWS